jgi:hypothetical protein
VTADRAALVEAVAQAISNAWDSEQRIFAAAEAAIDLIRNDALEEAARVCEQIGNVSAQKARDYVVDGLIPEARIYSGEVSGTDKAAAAIRALKGGT